MRGSFPEHYEADQIYGESLEPCKHIKDYILNGYAEALRDIVKALYGKETLDIAKLDDDINWLASELDVDMPHGQPTIQRKKEIPYLFDLAVATLDQAS